jgi:hypothetical protein
MGGISNHLCSLLNALFVVPEAAFGFWDFIGRFVAKFKLFLV